MKLLKFPIIKFTVFLIIGILSSYYWNIYTQLSITLVVLLGVLVLILSQVKKIAKSTGFGVLVFAMLISCGILTYNLHDQKRWNSHYTNLSIDNPSTIIFKIERRLKPTTFYNKYEAKVISVDSKKTTGIILLNIEKDSTTSQLAIDGTFFSFTILDSIRPPLNPNQFDYKNYLEKRYIYKQLRLKSSELISLNKKKHTLYSYADLFRNRVISNLKKSTLKTNELAIIKALLLGQRQDISKDIYDNFAKAGVIHILAVSGLHIGIILFILQFLLSPFNRIKHGNYIRMIIIVFLLWCFAIVAGLSPSVTRAVTMFTVVAIALNWKRFTNIYNTLAISIFVILLFKPLFLFDVGFQLSYVAVLAIVSFQPKFYRIIKRPNTLVLNKAWEIFTVTLAAQIGVLPLSLYYFHQFPGLFFVSNLLIIPALGLILSLGLLIIFLAYLNSVPTILTDIFGWIISTMNSFIKWVSSQENFLFQDIPFDVFQVITCYFLILMFYRLISLNTYKNLRSVLFSLLLIQCALVFSLVKNDKDRFIIFNKNRSSLIGIQNNSTLNVNSSSLEEDLSNGYILKNYKIGNRIKSIDMDTIKSVYKFKDDIILVIDSIPVYSVSTFKPSLILLRNSPKLNLSRMIDSLQPKQVVADASNYKSYVLRWKAKCLNKKTPFHSTYEKGAYILE